MENAAFEVENETSAIANAASATENAMFAIAIVAFASTNAFSVSGFLNEFWLC